MAPWEELRYFGLPVEKQVTVGAGVSPLIGADPMRVVLLVSSNASSTVTITTSPTSASGKGVQLTTSVPVVLFTARDTPGLTQAAWFVNASGPATVTVLSVSMIRWPQEASGSMPLPNQRLSDTAIRAMMGGLDA